MKQNFKFLCITVDHFKHSNLSFEQIPFLLVLSSRDGGAPGPSPHSHGSLIPSLLPSLAFKDRKRELEPGDLAQWSAGAQAGLTWICMVSFLGRYP